MDDFQERVISGLTMRIDRTLCIGNDTCTKIVPEVLELDDDFIAVFLDDAPDVARERLIEACEVCPVEALLLLDEDGHQVAP